MSPAPLTGIVDCDIHPAVRSMADLEPWLERKWIEHFREYGALRNQHYTSGAGAGFFPPVEILTN